MSQGLHLISIKIPGYGTSEGRCLPFSGISARSAVALYACHHDCKLLPRVRILLKNNTKRVPLACKASSGGHRRNPDFSRQNRQSHGFSRGKNKQNHEKANTSENLDEMEFLSSKNGPLLSLSGSPRFQATATPGPREKEIVELFRKVQAQLRERAAIKEEKRIEASQGQGERGTVDSLLKLLRKHSAEQGKRRNGSSSEDLNLDPSERSNTLDDEQNQNFFETDSIATEEIEETTIATPTRPASNFRRRSPVPKIKYQPIYSTDENIESIPSTKTKGKRKKSVIQSEPEPVSLESPHEALDEISESSDAEEVYGETIEPSSMEDTDLSSLKLSELRVLAKSRGVKGYSKMKKGQLLELLSQ